MKVYSDKGNPNLWKILIAAKYAGVDIEVANFNYGTDNKTPEFLAKSPLGKVPVLETSEGSIFEANAAARFVAHQGKNHLYGSTPFQAAQVDQWIDFASNEIDLPASVWIFPILGYIPNNPQATEKAKGDIRKILEILDKDLQQKTYLVGNRVTLADIVVAMSLWHLYTKVLAPGIRKPFINTNRWFTTIVNQPEVLAVVGETKLTEKTQVAPKETEAKKEEKKPAEKKEKKQETPKETKPKPKEDAEDVEGQIASEEAAEKKKPNPLDSLPPSKFVLDEWKRMYSNNDTRSVAIPWFWENFDPAGYSIWFCDYKYNDELNKIFMTCNLVGGFLQRVERLRKYGFGSMLIFGEDPNLEISGMWIFRGQDIPAEMQECDDCEHYTWRKADINDPATKELINDYLAWDGQLQGKKFNQGKIFK